MARNTTLGSIQFADLFEALRGLGADTAPLLARVGLPAVPPRDPATRVEASRALALVEAAGHQLQDPLIGLHAGARVQTRGPIYYLLLSSARVSEGLRLWTQFSRVTLDTLEVEVAVHRGIVNLTVNPGDPALEQSHHAIDYILGANLSSLRRAIPGFHLLEVTVAHPEIGAPGETARVFGCPVQFGRHRNVMRFPDSTLDSEPAAANPAIAEQIHRFTAAVFAQLTAGTVRDRAADAIRALLAAGLAPGRGAVARRLHMSERTLQRQLDQESISFKALRDGVRSELARALLANRALKVETVALTVGFAEVASFSKAFTRWLGHSPTRYRTLCACEQAPNVSRS